MRRYTLSIMVAVVALCVSQESGWAQADTGVVVEPASKRAFPVSITVPGAEQRHALAGTGIRTKTFLRVQVYAYGLYVEPAGARAALGAWSGQPATALKDDPWFYAALLQDNFAKSLRLHMTRDVGGDDMAEAFDDALGPRVDAAANRGMSGGRDALASFRGFFDVDELTKETTLTFSWLPGGTLVTAVNGDFKGRIESPALTWALFDVYLGERPIMKKGKETVIARMPEVLQ